MNSPETCSWETCWLTKRNGGTVGTHEKSEAVIKRYDENLKSLEAPEIMTNSK